MWNCWNANLSNGLYMVYPTIYWCSNFGTWNCWNAILGNGLYMLYHTIYEHSNFGTWNCWNLNPSNGLFALYSLHWCSNLEYLNYWDVSLLNIPEIVYVLSMVCLKCCGPLWLQKIITTGHRMYFGNSSLIPFTILRYCDQCDHACQMLPQHIRNN